jgi:NADP-dependent 3-hydroxy acid dehydrogenase YdfG
MDVRGKVVIVTGASTGIGLATARLFAQQGARLGLVARSAGLLDQLSQELEGSFAVPADLSKVEAVPAVMQQFHSHFGRVDILINNAGRAMHVPVALADVQFYRQLLDLNVVSVLAAMQSVVPWMRQQGGGLIINISSGLSKRIVPGVGPYASTKYALNALTLTARAELEPENIRVCLVLPGRTANTSFAQNAMTAHARPESVQAYAQGDPPEHVAQKILEAAQSEAAETYADSTRPTGQ